MDSKTLERIVVIKYGGNSITGSHIDDAFAILIKTLQEQGSLPIIVHGGGPHISRLLEAVRLPSEFIDGFRVTTAEAIPYVCMALSHVGQSIVHTLTRHGVDALTLNGDDMNAFTVIPYAPQLDRVGEVHTVNTRFFTNIVQQGIVPVIACFGSDEQGIVRNVNADSLAGAIAAELVSESLYMLTNVDGIYENWPDPDSLISTVTVADCPRIESFITTGMIPKLRACTKAVQAGVENAYIINGTDIEYVHDTIVHRRQAGTRIVAS